MLTEMLSKLFLSVDFCYFVFFSNNFLFESVKVQNKAKHFKIYQSGNEFYVLESDRFSSLPDLIQHYQSHPLSSLDKLEKPCVRVRQSELSVS